MYLPQITAAQRLYLNFMQQEFQLGPKQIEWLNGNPQYMLLKLKPTHTAVNTIYKMLEDGMAWAEVSAIIKAEPQQYFTEPV